MKKTILASAIAAATFSGAALAQESNLPTIYGNIQYALSYENYDEGTNSIDHFDNGSTLGVAHSHEIAPGVTGFFKLELEGINADNKAESNGIDGLDEAYIGVKGDNFGQIWVGSDDSTYETAVDVIANHYEVGTPNIGGDYDTGEGDLIQYMSPSFGGLKLGAAVQINGDRAAGAEKSYPYQLAAVYSVDALELAFAMDSNDASTGNNENTYGLRGTFSMDALSLTAQYQTRKDVVDVAGIMGVYTLGKNQFALSYEHASYDENQGAPGTEDKADTVSLQALHNLSDNMYVYFEGYLQGGDRVYEFTENGVTGYTDEKTVAAVGGVYYF